MVKMGMRVLLVRWFCGVVVRMVIGIWWDGSPRTRA